MVPLESLVGLLMAIPWYAWIAIVAIVAQSVVKLVSMNNRHNEKMEKIRHGIDPDAGPPRAEKVDD
jgi:hypothetical protein